MLPSFDVKTLILALLTVGVLHFAPGSLTAIGGDATRESVERIETVCPNVRCDDIDSCEHRVNRHCCADAGGTSCTTADCGVWDTCPPE